MTGNCGFPDGAIHLHQNSCYQAGRHDERAAIADVTALAMLLHDHRPETLLPPLLVSGCKCGWGSEVFAHSAHQANEVAKHLRTVPATRDRS